MALYSITGFEQVQTYSRGDIDGGFGASFLGAGNSGPGDIPFASETADGMPKHRQLTQEFRAGVDATGPLSWQGGVFFFHEDYKIESFSYDSLSRQRAGRLRARAPEERRLRGVRRAELRRHAGGEGARRRALHARQEDLRRRGLQQLAASCPACCRASARWRELAAQEPDGNLSASPKDSKFNWDLSGTYTLDKGVNLYARVATGFRGSSVQGAGAFNGKSVAGPETNTSFEAGVKADLLDGRARVSFGVFHYTVKDLQLTAVGGAGNANILLNAKKAVGQGFELDAQAFLTDQLMATPGRRLQRHQDQGPGARGRRLRRRLHGHRPGRPERRRC